MAMTVGELVGYLDMEDKGFEKELGKAGKGLEKLQSTTTSKTADIENVVKKAFFEVEEAIKDGLDPAEAIVDLDRLESGFDAALAEMLADADRTGKGIVNEFRSGIGDLDQVMREEGQRAGDELVDGLKAGLGDADRVARDAGRDAGKGFGDGVESSGGGGGGGRMAGIGSNLVGGLKAGAIGIAAAAGAAIGGAIIDGIKNALEREDLFAELAVKVGAFGEESERLGRIAGDLYADAYGESLEQVTGALARVLQNVDGAGQLGDDALKDMTKQALTVSRVMDEDVGAVTRAVSQMLRTGLASSAEEAFDVLVRGTQDGVNKSEDLLDSFNEYSTIFRDFGISADEALGLMAQGLRSGARDSDVVADSLKELQAKIKDGTAKDALKELGLNADKMFKAIAKGGPEGHKALGQILERFRDIKDPAEKAEIAAGLFGTKAEDMAAAINGIDLSTAKQEVGDFKGAVDTAGAELGSTAKADADRWSRSWEGAFSWMGEQVMKEVKRAFPSPADWEEAWGEITSWFEGTVGPFFSEAWDSVAETTSEIWTGIGDWLSEKTDEIVEWVGKVPGKIRDFFVNGWNDLMTKTGEQWEQIKSSATKKADELVTWLRELPGKIRDFFVNGWNDLKTKTGEQWAGIKKAATDKADELVTWLRELPGKIKEIFASAKDWLIQSGRDMIAGFINGVQQKAGELVSAARDVVDRAINAVTGKLESNSPSKVFERIGGDTIEGFILGVNGKGGLAAAVMQQMVGKAIAAAQEAARKTMAQKAVNIIRDVFADVLKGAAPNMVEGDYGLNGPNVVSALGATSSGALFGGSQPAGVTVNIKEATVREEADFAKIGSAVTFAVMGRGTV